jgi:putative DNA primase/helicase
MKQADPRGAQYHYCTTCGADLTVMDHLDWCTDEYRAADTVYFDGEKWVSASTTNGEGVYLVRASAIEPENVDYFEENLIPLKVVTLVTGLDGVGKSTILYAKAALATRGELPGAFEGAAVDVVVASSEDHPHSVIVPRLIAAGADLDRVHIVKVSRDGLEGDISLPDDLDAVALEAARVRARLLIADPLVAHMPLNIDSHKAQHVRQVLAPLARLAEERNLAVAAVVHFNGAPSTDVRSRISGSKALRDASRSVLVCGIDPDDESRFVLVQDKFSFGPKPTTGTAYQIETAVVDHKAKTFKTSRVVWLGEVEISSTGLLAGPGDLEERTERDEAGTFLDEMLAEGDIDADEVLAQAKKNGIAERTLRRAKRQRGIRSIRVGGPTGRWVWTRSEGGHDPKDGHPQKAGSLGNLHTNKGVPSGHLEEGGSLTTRDDSDILEDLGAYTTDDYGAGA